MTIRLFVSIAFTVTLTETSYISQVQVTCLPGSNRPVLFVNQNLDVIAGSINASNTSLAGLRMSIAAFATGACVNSRLFICGCFSLKDAKADQRLRHD